jgi:holliday junction DNA helicase RuvA
MIARICGTLIDKSATEVVVDTHGVGYRLLVPLTTFYELPEAGQQVTLHVHTQVKEDAITLFGFHSPRDREVFQLMITVSGIGPKLALNILSRISGPDFVGAVARGSVQTLVAVPGIGKKTADRMLLELRDKVGRLGPEAGSSPAAGNTREALREDALSALVNLGYRPQVAREILDKVLKQSGAAPTLDGVLKEALRILSR